MIEDAISEIGVKNWDEMGNLSEDLVTVTEPIEQTTWETPHSSESLDTPDKAQVPNDKSKSPREPSSRVKSNHSKDNIIGDLKEGMRLARGY